MNDSQRLQGRGTASRHPGQPLAAPGRQGPGSGGTSRRRLPPTLPPIQATTQRQQDALLHKLKSRVLPSSPVLPRHPKDHHELAGLSYVKGPTDVPLLEETVGQCLSRTAQTYPHSDAVVSLHQGGLHLSYSQLLAEAEAAARGLLALGVAKGDRVAIWAPNRAEWTVLQFAAAKAGAILVNINPAYQAAELAYALRQAGVTVLVLARGVKGGSTFLETVESIRQETPLLRHRVLLGEEGEGSPVPEGYGSWDALLEAGRGAGLEAALREREAQLLPDEPANIQYTSGTTGFPKAATLSHRNILNNGLFIASTCQYTQADRVCIPVPLYHCFGMVIGNMACVASGAAMVYPAEQYSPEATLAAVQAEGCTSLYGVPTMFIAALALPNFRRFQLSSLRTGVMAGSPCPVEVMKQVRQQMHMSAITICYGMTETSPVSFQTSTEDSVERRVSTVGRIHPHLEAKVIDPGSGATVPHGVVGELCVRGYSVMLGYWGDAAATAQAISKDGWMHTGDLATLDASGYCRVVGRIKDLVIRGGENIYPREIEEFLHSHPAVADVQVFGVPSMLYGEELCAWVKLRDGFQEVDRAQLRAWCRGRIARYKVPRYWKLVDTYPMTVSGKPQKYKMREVAVQELGLGQAHGLGPGPGLQHKDRK